MAAFRSRIEHLNGGLNAKVRRRNIKMKKLVALLLLFSSPVYALSDCADKPTCEEIGYTHNEYACDQKIAMPCPFDSSKIYCPGPVCEPGYFLYSDRSCSLALKSDKTVIGIVFDKEWRLAVSVEPVQSLRWANNGNFDAEGLIVIPDFAYNRCSGEECERYNNGRTNTQTIVNFAVANGYSYPAAEYCYNLSALGKGRGNWWLPSLDEWKKLHPTRETIDEALILAGSQATGDGSLWTSNQDENAGVPGSYGMFFRPLTNYVSGWNKRAALKVFCVTRY